MSSAHSGRNPATQTDEIRRAAGQKLLVGFSGSPVAAPTAIQSALHDGLGGIVLFSRNVSEINQFAALTTSVASGSASNQPPAFVAVDQEGGRVVRLRAPLSAIPPMREVGQMDDPEFTQALSGVMARELKAVGVNLNFAPVIDVDTCSDNPVIGDRSFSSDPQKVARHGQAFVSGHLQNGVLPCPKHFPGHGDTSTDSHLVLPTLMHDLKRLQDVELEPYRTLFQDDLPILMTAHVLFERMDSEHPATLSRLFVHELLRNQLGYQGLVITDCLEMKAVSARYSIEEMIELGLEAGVDIFLISQTESTWNRAWEHMIRLSEQSQDIRNRILSDASRIARCKKRYIPQRSADPMNHSILGCEAHQSILKPLARLGDRTTGLDPTERDG